MRRLFLPIIFLLISVAFLPVSVIAQGDASISSAKQQLVICYNSAKQAENAGANISSLTAVLNDAGGFLSRAELANSQGDFDAAQDLAIQCVQKLDGFVSQADRLRDTEGKNANFDFWVNVAGSIVGAFVVVAAGFLIWIYVKQRFVPVEVEPEVETDESSTV